MKNKYLDKLEYTKILNKLSNYAHTYIGKGRKRKYRKLWKL